MEDRNAAFDKLKIDDTSFSTASELSDEAKLQKLDAEGLSVYQHQKWRMELQEIAWKNKSRKIYGFIFTALLVVQNCFLAYFVYKAYTQWRIKELQFVLPIIIPATLLETAYIIRIMMEWIFSNTDYFNHKKTGKDTL